MVLSHTTFRSCRKRNLLLAAFAAVGLGVEVAQAQPTTFNFTNLAGGDLWMEPGNWNQQGSLPGDDDVARFPSTLSNHN